MSGVRVNIPTNDLHVTKAIEDCSLGQLAAFAFEAVDQDRERAAALACMLHALATLIAGRLRDTEPNELRNFPP